VGGHSHIFSGQKLLLLLLTGEQLFTSFVGMHCVLKSSLAVCWLVPHKGPDLPAVAKIAIVFINEFANSQSFICATCGG
jgi:hypothetical protein